MWKTLTTIVAIAVLVVVSAVPASADSATVTKRDGGFGWSGTTTLCNGDTIEYTAYVNQKSTAVVNDNARHYQQLEHAKNDWYGTSVVTGQSYRYVLTATVNFHNIFDGQTIDVFKVAVGKWIPAGPGPFSGPVDC